MKAEEILLKDLADHWIFFHAFEIAIAPPVRESIENEWRKIRDAALA
jgi:hypothetical protein